MDHGEYIPALRWNGKAAAQAARDTSMETMVPSCPEWNLRDLAHHLGSHHRWVAGNLDQPPDGPAFKQRDEPPSDEAIPDWLADGYRRTRDLLDDSVTCEFNAGHSKEPLDLNVVRLMISSH